MPAAVKLGRHAETYARATPGRSKLRLAPAPLKPRPINLQRPQVPGAHLREVDDVLLLQALHLVDVLDKLFGKRHFLARHQLHVVAERLDARRRGCARRWRWCRSGSRACRRASGAPGEASSIGTITSAPSLPPVGMVSGYQAESRATSSATPETSLTITSNMLVADGREQAAAKRTSHAVGDPVALGVAGGQLARLRHHVHGGHAGARRAAPRRRPARPPRSQDREACRWWEARSCRRAAA